jgi:glycosyltransferase involved in cell wall biosynthesis
VGPGARSGPLDHRGAELNAVGHPAVSVLVPTYNGSAYIGACIESILAQGFADYECLVYDDGSSDDTLAIVRGLTKGDRRFVVWRNPKNLGPQQNLVRLYEAARAPFVNWVLHDDVLHPDHLARLVPPLQQTDGLVLATAKRGLVDAAGAHLPSGFPFTALTEVDTVLDGRSLGDLVLEHAANVIGETTSVVLRKGLVPAADLWRCGERLLAGVADVWLWLRLLARGDAFYSPSELSWFRQHDAQSTARLRAVAEGTLDWVHVLQASRELGYLVDPSRERHAWENVNRQAANLLADRSDDPDARPLFETQRACLTRLEILAPVPA